jgi:predicted KAP-like P-loop ATPase
MTALGLRDIPIDNSKDELLGLVEYAKSLSEFIGKCDTPMTVALQGDWGSGKTSMMNLIQEEVAPISTVSSIWFNTWQYSQFDLNDALTVSLLSHFIDAIGLEEDKDKTQELLKGL